MENMMKGYKVLNTDQTNMFGKKFEVGHIYQTNNSHLINGYYFCPRLVDALAFSHIVTPTKDFCLAAVTGIDSYLDVTKEYYGDYYGIFDIYVAPKIIVNNLVARIEIIRQMLEATGPDLNIFLANLNLNDEELKMMIARFQNDFKVMKNLLYYQFAMTDIYEQENNDVEKRIRSIVQTYHK